MNTFQFEDIPRLPNIIVPGSRVDDITQMMPSEPGSNRTYFQARKKGGFFPAKQILRHLMDNNLSIPDLLREFPITLVYLQMILRNAERGDHGDDLQKWVSENYPRGENLPSIFSVMVSPDFNRDSATNVVRPSVLGGTPEMQNHVWGAAGQLCHVAPPPSISLDPTFLVDSICKTSDNMDTFANGMSPHDMQVSSILSSICKGEHGNALRCRMYDHLSREIRTKCPVSNHQFLLDFLEPCATIDSVSLLRDVTMSKVIRITNYLIQTFPHLNEYISLKARQTKDIKKYRPLGFTDKHVRALSWYSTSGKKLEEIVHKLEIDMVETWEVFQSAEQGQFGDNMQRLRLRQPLIDPATVVPNDTMVQPPRRQDRRKLVSSDAGPAKRARRTQLSESTELSEPSVVPVATDVFSALPELAPDMGLPDRASPANDTFIGQESRTFAEIPDNMPLFDAHADGGLDMASFPPDDLLPFTLPWAFS